MIVSPDFFGLPPFLLIRILTTVIGSIIIRILKWCIYVILRCVILCVYVHRVIIPCDNFVAGVTVKIYSLGTQGRMSVIRKSAT